MGKHLTVIHLTEYYYVDYTKLKKDKHEENKQADLKWGVDKNTYTNKI